MAKKKQDEVKVYMVFVRPGSKKPIEVMCPDGEMALLMPWGEGIFMDNVHEFKAVVRRKRGGKYEFVDENVTVQDVIEGSWREDVKNWKLEEKKVVTFN